MQLKLKIDALLDIRESIIFIKKTILMVETVSSCYIKQLC